MPLFDQETIVKLISELRRNVSRLRELARVPEEEFLNNPDKIGSSKYYFIVAIESSIDMCNHLIARNGYRVPYDYGDTFTVMGEVGALDREFADALRNMAKFRTRLVHPYWEIDDQQLYGILQSRLNDFKQFLNAVSAFLGWQSKGFS